MDQNDKYKPYQKKPFEPAAHYSLSDIVKEAKERGGTEPIDLTKTDEILSEFATKTVPVPQEPEQPYQQTVESFYQKQKPQNKEEIDGQLKLFEQEGKEKNSAPAVDEKVLNQKRRERAKRFVLTGAEESGQEDVPFTAQPRPEIDDFESYEDAKSIQMHLQSQFLTLLFRFCFSLLALLVTVWLALTPYLYASTGVGLPFHTLATLSPMLCLSINAAVLMLTASVNSVIFMSTFKSAVKFHTCADMPTAIAVLVVLIHTFVMFGFTERIADLSVALFTAPAILLLCANAGGKLLKLSRIKKNFPFVAAKGMKNGVQMLPNDHTTRDMCRNILGTPYIAMPKRAGFLSSFLDYSYGEDPCAYLGGLLSPCVLLAGIATTIASLIINNDGAATITSLAAICCLAAPISSLIGGNLPLKLAATRLRKRGAMLTGYPSVDELFLVNGLTVDAADLFPEGSITLNGIKTFSGGRIDQAILDTAALVYKAGGPLVPVFEKVIQGNAKILPAVDTLVYEQGMGISGWVDGRRVLAGNRDLLINHGIEPPSLDYEKRYLRSRRKLIYLCSAGELCAMFVLTYQFSPYIRYELDRFAGHGIGLLVHSCDPNVTVQLLCEGFHIAEQDVLVLNAASAKEFEDLNETQEVCDACAVYDGKIAGLMDILSTSVRLNSIIKLSLILQVIGILMGFLLTAFLTFYGGLDRLFTLPVLLFQIFWLIAGTLPSLLRSSK